MVLTGFCAISFISSNEYFARKDILSLSCPASWMVFIPPPARENFSWAT